MVHISPREAFLLVLPTILWAANAVAGRLAVGAVSPILLNTLRWTLAALILLPLGWRVFRQQSSLWSHLKRFALLGLLGVGCYNALLYLALQTSTPINVTLIGASMPIWMLLIGAVFYGSHPTVRQVIGAFISLLGVVVVLRPEKERRQSTRSCSRSQFFCVCLRSDLMDQTRVGPRFV